MPRSEASGSLTGWLALVAALTMLFASLASAYVVRRGLASDWKPLALPLLVWAGAGALVLNSALLEWGRGRERAPRGLAVVLGLAAALLIGEICRELAQAGAEPSTNAAAAFYFVFSGAIVVCIAGGLLSLRRTASRSVVLYWHYLSAVWIWILLLFTVWP